MSIELTIFGFLRSQSLRLMGVKIRGTLGVPFKGVSLIILPTWYYLSDPEQSACSRPAPCRCTPGKSGATRFVPLHGKSKQWWARCICGTRDRRPHPWLVSLTCTEGVRARGVSVRCRLNQQLLFHWQLKEVHHHESCHPSVSKTFCAKCTDQLN